MRATHHSNEPGLFKRYLSASAPRVVLALVLLSLLTVISFAARTKAASPAAVSAPGGQTAAAHAEVVLDATRRDYGEVFAGEELDYPFYLTNAGKAPLELMPRRLTSRSLSWGPRVALASLVDAKTERYRLVPVAARLAAPS